MILQLDIILIIEYCFKDIIFFEIMVSDSNGYQFLYMLIDLNIVVFVICD